MESFIEYIKKEKNKKDDNIFSDGELVTLTTYYYGSKYKFICKYKKIEDNKLYYYEGTSCIYDNNVDIGYDSYYDLDKTTYCRPSSIIEEKYFNATVKNICI